jgi:hypothetical protein
MAAFCVVAPCSLVEVSDVPEVIAVSIIMAMKVLMLQKASIFETSVNFYQTARSISSEDSYLHIRHRADIKPHLILF